MTMTQTKVNRVRRSRILAVAAVIVSLNGFAVRAAHAEDPAAAPAALPAALSTAQFVAVMSSLADFEQRAGKMAEVLAHSNDVRRFGRDLAEDQRNRRFLSEGLAQSNMAAPISTSPAPNQLDILFTLNRRSDREFDRTFLDMQVRTHQDALSIVEAYARTGDNPALKTAAARMIGPLLQRLEQAQSMLNAVG
jgi:putative membrane protein